MLDLTAATWLGHQVSGLNLRLVLVLLTLLLDFTNSKFEAPTGPEGDSVSGPAYGCPRKVQDLEGAVCVGSFVSVHQQHTH